MTWFGVANSGEILYSTNNEGLYDFSELYGDVEGTLRSSVVSSLRGLPIATGTPQTDQILKWNGSEWTYSPDASGDTAVHSLLGAYHSDTTSQTPTRGSLIYGNATPLWDELTLGTAEFVLYSDGTDVLYTRLGAVTPFSLGTSAAPSVTFTGDIDTGWSAESADTMIGSASGIALLTLDGGIDGVGGVATLNAGQVVKVTNVGASTTLNETQYIINATANNITITLPAAPTTGQVYYIKDGTGVVTPAAPITINGNGNNIDGNAFIRLRVYYGAFTLVYNGTQWNVI